MGELGAFLKIDRSNIPYRDPNERVADFQEFVVQRSEEEVAAQGARCMECGVPFCHNGCPLGNLIPDWNDLVYRGRWADAIKQLHATNNFPEFTGRLCPAPCEASCVLEIREGDAVTIKQIENSIINRAWDEGWVVPQPPRVETGRSAAVVGAGPAGMAAAQQLRRAGHRVVLFERDEAGGGLVRFGVPDFKIEKWLVERRMDQLRAEGVEVRCGVDVGRDVTADELRAEFDAVVLTIGSRATCRRPAASSTASTTRWTTCTCATARSRRRSAPSPRPNRRHRRRSPRRASTSSSSAAATPAPTASGTPSARAR
jgi:glutamate synthase (NADPH) small chain